MEHAFANLIVTARYAGMMDAAELVEHAHQANVRKEPASASLIVTARCAGMMDVVKVAGLAAES